MPSEVSALHEELCDDARRRRLVRLCAAITGDRGAAEDLAQETLLEAWRNAHKLHDLEGLERWLAAVARNVCLRWSRSRGREVTLVELPETVGRTDLEAGLERSELVELLDRALAQLSPAQRDVLIRRYVHDSSHARIAAELGVSVDAVAMRLARGKRQLQLLLDEQHDDGWRETRIWCADCGRRTLVQRRTTDSIRFRCRGCDVGAISHEVPLTNPFFSALMADALRPSTILNRLAAWSRRHFGGGIGVSSCTRCAEPVRVARDPQRNGLMSTCSRCNETLSSSLRGIAVAEPDVRRFRRQHPRSRIAREWEVEHDGLQAVVVRFEAAAGTAAVETVIARDTLRVL
jgi:RNA polymerase sigma factor (sigma-70 family)